MAEVYDQNPCVLGEGPLWHPDRNQLFWFDIIQKRMHSKDDQFWQFDEHVSAAGWIDIDHLLIASETALIKFNLETGTQTEICALEAESPDTRSNDGRADPWGGFWIGTMAKDGIGPRGAIYRYYLGELRQLFAPVMISNAIAFAPDKSCAYWADTAAAKVFAVSLDHDGWPAAAPTVFLDMKQHGLNPDGAIVAADGSYLNAQWGASRVARYSPDGLFIEAFNFPTSHITCPAFAGPDLSLLVATSARQGLEAQQLEAEPLAGQTFCVETDIKGLPEYQVLL
ncbi:MAG: SMP-30/gluconolactonase/LRE family protein [Pseudomonadota bacterium]